MAYRRALSRRRYLTSRHFYTRLDLDEVASQFADASAGPGKLEESIDEQCGKGSLQRVFAALSENQGETLRLFFAEGYTFDEIATKLGQSRGNIKHHYFRALDRLRKALFGGKLPGDRAREEFLCNLGAGSFAMLFSSRFPQSPLRIGVNRSSLQPKGRLISSSRPQHFVARDCIAESSAKKHI
jgi:predicted DNA-binding protein (UPF0251 family)